MGIDCMCDPFNHLIHDDTKPAVSAVNKSLASKSIAWLQRLIRVGSNFQVIGLSSRDSLDMFWFAPEEYYKGTLSTDPTMIKLATAIVLQSKRVMKFLLKNPYYSCFIMHYMSNIQYIHIIQYGPIRML